jgi:hypothetical protein
VPAAPPQPFPDVARLNRHDVRIACGIAALALVVRLMFLASSPDRAWPHSIWYEGDSPEWVNYAAALDQGRTYEFGLPLRSPAAAYLLHWLQAGITHGPFTGFKVAWCGISTLTCSLVYLCFVLNFGRRIALIAAGLCVWSFGLYITATSLNNESLYTFTLVAVVLATTILKHHPRAWLAVLVGILHGVATLIRPEHTLLLFLLLPWMLWGPYGSVRTTDSIRSRLTTVATVVLVSILTCLPWSIQSMRATRQFNETAKMLPDFDHANPPWTPDGRAFIESMPPFAQQDNFAFITAVAAAQRARSIDAAFARSLLIDEFGALPEPLNPWIFVSSQGPLSFALANHPDARGEFSKAALVIPKFGADPRLNFTMPWHAHLYNHGYAVGWGYIVSDVPGWFAAVCRKLSTFSEGATLGFTAWNLPEGREGVRRPVDLFTAKASFTKDEMGSRLVHKAWRFTVCLLLLVGAAMVLRRRTGGIWLIILLYKVIVTIAFYGYARQAVSIAPAFFAFMAVPLDGVMRLIEHRITSTGAKRLLVLATIALPLAIDSVAAIRGQNLNVQGPQTAKPQWGPSSFESYKTIAVKPSS